MSHKEKPNKHPRWNHTRPLTAEVERPPKQKPRRGVCPSCGGEGCMRCNYRVEDKQNGRLR